MAKQNKKYKAEDHFHMGLQFSNTKKINWTLIGDTTHIIYFIQSDSHSSTVNVQDANFVGIDFCFQKTVLTCFRAVFFVCYPTVTVYTSLNL